MAQVKYNSTSPYASTDSFGNFLDVMTYRDIPKDASDVTYQIDIIYKFRPDLLAYDLYGDSRLWWVFAMRNPNILQDPIFDFLPGATIYLPKKSTLIAALGL